MIHASDTRWRRASSTSRDMSRSSIMAVMRRFDMLRSSLRQCAVSVARASLCIKILGNATIFRCRPLFLSTMVHSSCEGFVGCIRTFLIGRLTPPSGKPRGTPIEGRRGDHISPVMSSVIPTPMAHGRLLFTLWDVGHGVSIWINMPNGSNHWIDLGRTPEFSPSRHVSGIQRPFAGIRPSQLSGRSGSRGSSIRSTTPVYAAVLTGTARMATARSIPPATVVSDTPSVGSIT